jgi:DNA-directed RNA polymerase specialized sigma24 family protein
MAMPEFSSPARTETLADPELRAALLRFVARRLNEIDAEDVVQATLTEAFASPKAPTAPEELRRWVFGIAKNKVVDVYRRTKREAPPDSGLSDEASVAESAPLSARELLRWAENELPDNEGADSTLEWMLREGDGEKLEHIAEEAALPPARVRQRVSRLRRHYRARWAAQLAAVAALAVLALAVWAIWRGRAVPTPEDIAEEKHPMPPTEKPEEIRRLALQRCDAEDWKPCIDGLDRAKALDPTGDRDERVQRAREAAARAKEPNVTPPSPAPTGSGPAPKTKPITTDSLEDFQEPKKAPIPQTKPPQGEKGAISEPPKKPQVAPKAKATKSEKDLFEAPAK